MVRPRQSPQLLSPTPRGADGRRANAMQHAGLGPPNQTTLEVQDPGNFFDHRPQGVKIVSLHQNLDSFDDSPSAEGLE
jgi:hypothetical protein